MNNERCVPDALCGQYPVSTSKRGCVIVLVEKLMSPNAVSVTQDMPVSECARLMAQRGIGALPVTASDGRLLGIVTDRDIVIRCIASEAEPRETTAGEVMSRNPETVSPGADVREAAAVMAGGKIRRLPVTDGGRLVGMISLADIARSRSCDTEAGIALSRISEPGGRFR